MPKTQPEPIRDQKSDHLLTPENCVVVLIDYQPEQYRTVTSSTREEIDLNVIAVCKLARAYDIPVIVSTVGVDMGVNTGTAEGIHAHANPGAADEIKVDHVRQVGHIGTHEVVLARRARVARCAQRYALHALQCLFEILIGLLADPLRDIGAGRPTMRRVVLEPPVVWWIV